MIEVILNSWDILISLVSAKKIEMLRFNFLNIMSFYEGHYLLQDVTFKVRLVIKKF